MSAYALLDHRVASRGNLGRASPPVARPDRAAQGGRRSEGGPCSAVLRPPSRPRSHHLMRSHGHTEGTQTLVGGGPEVFRLSSPRCHLPRPTLLLLKSCPFVPVGRTLAGTAKKPGWLGYRLWKLRKTDRPSSSLKSSLSGEGNDMPISPSVSPGLKL